MNNRGARESSNPIASMYKSQITPAYFAILIKYSNRFYQRHIRISNTDIWKFQYCIKLLIIAKGQLLCYLFTKINPIHLVSDTNKSASTETIPTEGKFVSTFPEQNKILHLKWQKIMHYHISKMKKVFL